MCSALVHFQVRTPLKTFHIASRWCQYMPVCMPGLAVTGGEGGGAGSAILPLYIPKALCMNTQQLLTLVPNPYH